MSGASAVIHKQNKLINRFNEVGAVDAEHAISLTELNISQSFIFNRMVLRGVFIETERGKFFIDNAAVPRFKEQRRKRALIAFVVVMIIGVLYYLIGNK